jgi:hypothetical protein
MHSCSLLAAAVHRSARRTNRCALGTFPRYSPRNGEPCHLLDFLLPYLSLSHSPQANKQCYLTESKQLKGAFNNNYPDYVYRRRPTNSRKRRAVDDAEGRLDTRRAQGVPSETADSPMFPLEALDQSSSLAVPYWCESCLFAEATLTRLAPRQPQAG